MFSATVRFARAANVLRQTVRVARLSSTLPPKVKEFVDKAVSLCRPDKVHVCTGSQQEYDTFLAELIKAGTVIKLDQKKRPGCYAAFTNPADVARAEKDTYICSEEEKDAGPTNNWVNPAQKREQLKDLFNGSMRGRTMYVVPFSMGPLGSPFSKIGIQVTDSSFVVANMRIMTRMGTAALEKLGTNGDFVPCMHSVGQPIVPGTENTEDGKLARSTWPCNIKNRNVVQFPESREIWSFGSGYGGNSLLGKKCFALRIASVQARDEGWLAEHMLILGITNPKGVKRYVAAAFPSACGKTNLAMMQPNLPGWKIETVGDDIAWMRPGADGRLYAINPEYGFFGVAPGTSSLTNPNAMKTCAANSLFTNVGVTNGGDVYWEGMDAIPDDVLTDWKGRKNWLPTLKPNFKGKGTGWNNLGYKIDEKTDPCAQPNSRFTTPITQCPVLDPKWEDPAGVPISAIMFGGRRNDTLPLIFETESWQHGTFTGSIMRSEATSAADQVGLTNDPMAMKAFCGYNVKDYFAHWLRVGSKSKNMPKVFQVNWFRKNAKGDFLWPGFGDNIRVLKWIFERCENPSADNFQSTPIGRVPKPEALDVSNLKVSAENLKELLYVDKKLWLKEAKDARAYYADLSKKTAFKEPSVPTELFDELRRLEQRLQ